MRKKAVLSGFLLLASAGALGQETAEEAPPEAASDEASPGAAEAEAEAEAAETESPSVTAADGSGQTRSMLGISILGNEEAPTSLVIVPWKSSEIGNGIDVENVLDDRAAPVDRDVFLRELRYYQIRSNGAE